MTFPWSKIDQDNTRITKLIGVKKTAWLEKCSAPAVNHLPKTAGEPGGLYGSVRRAKRRPSPINGRAPMWEWTKWDIGNCHTTQSLQSRFGLRSQNDGSSILVTGESQIRSAPYKGGVDSRRIRRAELCTALE